MDISDITDIQQLKAIAYDQMLMLDRLQQNLALIHARISELESQPEPPTVKQLDGIQKKNS